METPIAYGFSNSIPLELLLTDNPYLRTISSQRPFGTEEHDQKLGVRRLIAINKFKAKARPRSYETSPDIDAESVDGAQIFDAIQSLYLSTNRARNRKIADRIIALYRDALAEDEHILSASLRQFTEFFLGQPDP